MAGDVCANHQDTKDAISTLFQKADNHEGRIDVLEQGAVLRTEQISTLCTQMEKTVTAFDRNTKYIVTTILAMCAIGVPVFIWAVDKLVILIRMSS